MSRLPVSDFLTQRLAEYDPSFELRKGTGFEHLFFKPLQFITQPIIDEAARLEISQSFRRILQTDQPDSFDEEAVDALASNLFVYRAEGTKSSGLARVYYQSPVTREFPTGGMTFTGSNGSTYTNPAPVSITQAQMWVQLEGGLYYFDVPVESVDYGESTELDAGGLVSLDEDTAYISVSNIGRIEGGRVRETNTQLIERTRNSIAVRDLVTGKGFSATMFENFANTLAELQPIGMGDEEMMRDIKFNTHIGGKIDGFVKTAMVRQGSKIFTGMLVDTTRQASTTANIELPGTTPVFMGNTAIDRSNGLNPVVQQVKPIIAAVYVSTINMEGTLNLSATRYVSIGVDGQDPKTILVAGVHPNETARNEIVAYINAAFGYKLAAISGNSIKLTSPTKGKGSQILIKDPDSLVYGASGIKAVFNLDTGSVYQFFGDGPIVFAEGTHYSIKDADGTIQRVIGDKIIFPQTTGESTLGSNLFYDGTPGRFVPVTNNDILTITSGEDAGDYRILSVNGSYLALDGILTEDAEDLEYYINRTGIKDGEMVFIRYYFNPLSVDIGKLVKLDAEGKTRGIRPGRGDRTITDVAFLRVRSVISVDPVTGEPLGEPLRGVGGFGSGGYGEGPFGIGSKPDYYMVVNEPTARFSAWEDSYLIFNSAFQGLSLKVEYDYVPEIEAYHLFVRGENERVLDGDILVRHFIPVYVSGTITYTVDKTDSSIPTNTELQSLVRDFISTRKAGQPLDYTDINNFIMRKTDPYAKYGTKIKRYKLRGTILHVDGSSSGITGENSLAVVTPSPFPKFTTAPISARTSHWIASDELVLVRE